MFAIGYVPADPGSGAEAVSFNKGDEMTDIEKIILEIESLDHPYDGCNNKDWSHDLVAEYVLSRESALRAELEANKKIYRKLKGAVKNLDIRYLKHERNGSTRMDIAINCAPGYYARFFIGVKDAYKDNTDAAHAIDILHDALREQVNGNE